MTPLKKPVSRMTLDKLDGFFGPDRGRRLAVTLIPGRPPSETSDGFPDLLELRPEKTTRPERIAIADVYAYAYAIRVRVNRELLERARAKKEKLAAARVEAAARRAEAKRKRDFRNAVRREKRAEAAAVRDTLRALGDLGA